MAPPRKKQGAQEHGDACQHAPANSAAACSNEQIARPATEERADRHREKWQHRVVRTCFQVQVTHVVQINEEPGKEDVGYVPVTKIAESQRQHIFARKNLSPRQWFFFFYR